MFTEVFAFPETAKQPFQYLGNNYVTLDICGGGGPSSDVGNRLRLMGEGVLDWESQTYLI